MAKRTSGPPDSTSTSDSPDSPDLTGSTPSSHAEATEEFGLPGLDRLLALTGGGDQASFAAFYDATAPWVYGLATQVLASADDAAEATVLTYLQVWDQAGDQQFEGEDAWARHRAVLCWLAVLAHQTLTSLLRHDALPGYGSPLLPEAAGAGPATGREPTDVLSALTGAQYEALDLAWAGGRTYRQVADELQMAVPTVKSRLRDAVQRLSHRYQDRFSGRSEAEDPVMRRAVTPEVAARTGTQRNFTLNLSNDLDNGLAREWADLVALDALDDAERFELEAHVDAQGPEFATLWRARLEAARRTVTWAFRDLVREPPSSLLDEVLHRLPAQDVGMGLVDGLGPPRQGETDEPAQRRPVTKWMLVVAAVLVLAIGGWAIWRVIAGPDIVGAVNRAEDNFITEETPLADGGAMRGHVSRERDMAYVEFTDMPDPGEGNTYQLWLYPRDGSAPADLGTRSAERLEDPVAFRGVNGFEDLTITVEPEGGSDRPGGEMLGEVDLLHQVTMGPQYGGHPNSTPSPTETE